MAGIGLWLKDRELDHSRYRLPSPDWIPGAGVWLEGAVGGLLGLLSGTTSIGCGIRLVPVLNLMDWAPEKATASVGALLVLDNTSAGLASLLHRRNPPLPGTLILGLTVVAGRATGSWFGARNVAHKTVPRTIGNLLLVVTALIVHLF